MTPNETFLLVCKVLVFLYILSAVFIDHHKYLADLNNIAFQVIMVVLIAISAFVDFQLAILLTLALFIMIIMFNYKKPPGPVSVTSVAPVTPQPVIVTSPSGPEPFSQVIQEAPVAYESDIMHSFPDATCNTKPFEDTQLSENMFGYFIDPKVKPYEVYLRMITNEENLQKAQTNLIHELH
jgi:hypothetical protein